MDYQQVAAKVLSYVGDARNVDHVTTCLTRLRVAVKKMDLVEFDELRRQQGVLGVVVRNQKEVEIVFGPAAIEGIAQEFACLSGLKVENLNTGDVVKDSQEAPGPEPEHDETVSEAHLRTHGVNYTITPAKRQSYRAQQRAAITDGRLVEEDILALQDFLAENGDMPKPQQTKVRKGKSILVINGPNLNMLGTREPGLYGSQDYNMLVRICKAAAQEAGFSDIRCYQSNHEGNLVDEIQCALGAYDGIVINPAAYTHTSVAILDAVKAVDLPCIEVHISKVEERENFRQVSYIRQACFETITGLGLEGYRKAILDMAQHLGL